MSEPELESLRLTYERLREESRRLRDARAHFARGLGPAPASAGIATAVTAALGEPHSWLVYVALGLLALMTLVGMAYAGKPAYRQLYAKRVREDPSLAPERLAELPERDWYRRMIELELSIYGRPLLERNTRPHPLAKVDSLQRGADAERTGALAIELLWVGVMVCLVLSLLV